MVGNIAGIVKLYLVIAVLLGRLPAAKSQSGVGSQPKLFLPGIVSTGLNERDMAISPDARDMYYTIQAPRLSFSTIVHRVYRNNKCGNAEIAFFSGQYADLEPEFSPDGKRLFFVSNRPLMGDSGTKDYDIWYVEKNSSGWGTPVNAGPEVNSADNEFYPSITTDGSVYFTAIRPDTLGQEDIYKSKWTGNQFMKPENIGPVVNSRNDEFNAFVDPLERFIIFSVEGDAEGYIGRGDLYISYRPKDGNWGKPVNLGPAINTNRLDYCPFVHNGILYFTSERVEPVYKKDRVKLSFGEVINKLNRAGNGFGDIWSIPVSKILNMK